MTTRNVMPEIDEIIELEENGGYREVPSHKYLSDVSWYPTDWLTIALHPSAIRHYGQVA